MTPADGPDSRNQSEPVHKENENENGRKKPKTFPHQLAADDVFQKTMEAFNQPFPKILDAAGNRFHPASGNLCENNDHSRDDPRHQHGVCDSKTMTEVDQHLRLQWDA